MKAKEVTLSQRNQIEICCTHCSDIFLTFYEVFYDFSFTIVDGTRHGPSGISVFHQFRKVII